MNVNGFFKGVFISLILFAGSSSYCANLASVDETCLDNGRNLDIMNDQVLQWKTSTKTGFLARARIQGIVDEVFPDHTGHRHFSLKIGPAETDHIEVIYNLTFGNLPTPSIGETAEACGDYITSASQKGGYQPSPDGAIIHWVHRSPNGHDQGYVILNGVRY
ncbi:MAG: hypothetical protein ACXVCP_18315 [Bdellovibrio sp.]